MQFAELPFRQKVESKTNEGERFYCCGYSKSGRLLDPCKDKRRHRFIIENKIDRSEVAQSADLLQNVTVEKLSCEHFWAGL